MSQTKLAAVRTRSQANVRLWQLEFFEKLAAERFVVVLSSVDPRGLPARRVVQRPVQGRSFDELRPCTDHDHHAFGGIHLSHPSSAKLTKPSPATITWSRTGKSRYSPARQRLAVSSLSDALGLGLPEGWLCTSTMAAALSAKALPKTSLGSTTVPVNPPREMQTSARTWLDLRSKGPKTPRVASPPTAAQSVRRRLDCGPPNARAPVGVLTSSSELHGRCDQGRFGRTNALQASIPQWAMTPNC